MHRFASILFAGAIGAALLGACGDDKDNAGSAATSTTTRTPAYAGELKVNLERIMQDLQVPSAVVMIRSESKGDWSATFGTRTVGGNDPVTMEDNYRIGSNTKTMTATVVLQLVQEGKLSLDDPVSKYLPEVPGGDNITIAMLLDMRSGLADYTEDEGFQARFDNEPNKVWQPSELLAVAFTQPPSFPPGESFQYSSTNTILLGLVVENVTGGSLKDELHRRIFDPLKLDDAVYPAPGDGSIPSPHPRGYMFGTLQNPVLSPPDQEAAAQGTLLPNDVTDSNPSWAGAAGAAISDADDLARYVEALVDGGLLGPELQQTRLASIKSMGPDSPATVGYGLGIIKFGPLLGHNGGIPGFSTVMGRDPEARNTVIVLTSILQGGAQPLAPADEMLQAISAALYGQPTPDGSLPADVPD